MYSNFYFLENVQYSAYDLAVNMEQNIIEGKQISEQSLGQFLEILVNDMLKRKLRFTPPTRMDFSKKLSKLLSNNKIKHDFKKDLQDAYDKRSEGVHIDPVTNKPTEHSSMFYSHLIKKLHYLAYRYYRVVKDENFEKKPFISPTELNRESEENIKGKDSTSFLINQRNQGNIRQETIECIFTNTIKEDSKFESQNIGNFVWDVKTPIISSDKKDSIDDIDEKIENPEISSQNKENLAEINFNKFLDSILENHDVITAKEDNGIQSKDIINWYKKHINKFIQSKKDTNFKQSFLLITEYLMKKWLDLRNQNFSKKEITKKLNLNKDIVNFWFKKSVKNNLYEEYPIFNDFLLQNDFIDMYLIVNSISDNKSREEIAKDANVSVSDLNNYYLLGIAGNEIYIPFYKDFKNKYVYKRMGMYLENLRTLKSSEAQLKSKITDEELFGWYDQGKIDFVSGNLRTEKFQDFFLLRFIFLSNKWLELIKNSYSIKRASKEVEITIDEIQEWVNYGFSSKYENLKGFKNFEAFAYDAIELIINSMIKLLDEGKSIKEAANELEIPSKEFDKFYELGSKGNVAYTDYYNYLKNNYFPERMNKFLKYLSEGKAKNNAAKLSQLSVDEVDEWYSLGKQGYPSFIKFYKEYLKIKIETYKDYLVKGKSKKDALRLADLEEDEILDFQEEINKDILKKRMDSVIKEVLNNKDSAKIASKLKIKQSTIFEWFEKGFNGEKDYVDFYKNYYENYVNIGCEIVSDLFEEGLNKKQIVKQMKKRGQNLNIEDIEHWQKLGLLDDGEIHKDKKVVETVETKEIGIEVEDIGKIRELEESAVSKNNNLCLFDDTLKLIENEEDYTEFKPRLNYIDFENRIKISPNINKIIGENFVEIEYSKRLQLSYLNILHYRKFDDYENIWYWVLKKANDPDFDIRSISKDKVDFSQDEASGLTDDEFVSQADVLSEDDSLIITAEDLEFEDDSLIESYLEYDPLEYLDDYGWEEDELKDDEEKERDYQLVSQFIKELGQEDEIFDLSIDEEETHEVLEFESVDVTESPDLVESVNETMKSDSDISNQKLKSLFGDKIINKELTKSIKEEFNLPNYVIEFIIDKFSENGIDEESITKVLKYSSNSIIPKGGVVDVVDKVSVSLFYKANKYIATFNNLGYKLEIDPSYPFQYEKLLSGNVWAYVKLNNAGDMRIEDLELIEGPYFSLDEIVDNRKEFTKEEWIDLLINSCGINSKSLTHETKLLLLLRLTPFVEKNFYLCEIATKNSFKNTFYKNITFNNDQIYESLYGLFYNQQKHKKGAISYYDSINVNHFSKIFDINRKASLINYMSKNDKSNRDSYNETSLIFFNYADDYVLDFVKNANKSDRLIHSLLCDNEFLENIHCIIPSFENEEFNNLSKKEDILSEDYGFNNIVMSEYFNKLRSLDYTELYGKYFRLGKGININDFNAIKLMSSALIKLLYPDNVYGKEDIREIIEVCLKSRKIIKKILNQEIELSYIDIETSEEIVL